VAQEVDSQDRWQVGIRARWSSDSHQNGEPLKIFVFIFKKKLARLNVEGMGSTEATAL
jgi:hypothetical protein